MRDLTSVVLVSCWGGQTGPGSLVVGVGLKTVRMCLTHSEIGFQRSGGGEYKELLCQSGCVDCSACSARPALSTLAGENDGVGIIFFKSGKCASRMKEEIKDKGRHLTSTDRIPALFHRVSVCVCWTANCSNSALLVLESPLLSSRVLTSYELFTRISLLPSNLNLVVIYGNLRSHQRFRLLPKSSST